MSGITLRTLLSTALLLLLAGAEADAYKVDLIANWDPTLACTPGTCITDVTPSVEVWLDTEGEADIVLVSFGVSFAYPSLAYVPASSSIATYLLYTSAKTPYLVPAPVCCEVAPGDPSVFNLGFLSTAAAPPLGVPTAGREQMALLVFEVVAPISGAPLIGGVLDTNLGHVLQLGDGTTPPLGFTVTYAPEPATGLLVGLGLVAFGAARRAGPKARRGAYAEEVRSGSA